MGVRGKGELRILYISCLGQTVVLVLGWEKWEKAGGKDLVQTEVWILVSQSRMEPTPTAVEAWSLNHWTAREVPRGFKTITLADIG